jgi:hypothetical protein
MMSSGMTYPSSVVRHCLPPDFRLLDSCGVDAATQTMVGILIEDQNYGTFVGHCPRGCIHDLKVSHFVVINSCDIHFLEVFVDNACVVACNSTVRSPIYECTLTFYVVCRHEVMDICDDCLWV